MNNQGNWLTAQPASSPTTSEPHPKASPTAPITCESTPTRDGTPTQSSTLITNHIAHNNLPNI